MTNYKSPISFGNGHIETLIPFFFRRKKKVRYMRERLDTSDGDFLILDWLKNGSDKVVIISHGMESCTHSENVLGMAHHFHENNFDVLAWNGRGCTGELNKKEHYYHSGFSFDLREVAQYTQELGYKEIYFVGFSLGGNLTLKFLGEEGAGISNKIKGACVFSVPIELESVSRGLSEGFNRVYGSNFLKTLRKKIIQKKRQFPELKIDLNKLAEISTLFEFDENFTCEMFGYNSANDYYKNNSSLYYLEKIKVRTLIVNAKNDPFLTESCFPHEKISKNTYLSFETPEHGGHCGFFQFSRNNILWSESRAVDFLT